MFGLRYDRCPMTCKLWNTDTDKEADTSKYSWDKDNTKIKLSKSLIDGVTLNFKLKC